MIPNAKTWIPLLPSEAAASSRLPRWPQKTWVDVEIRLLRRYTMHAGAASWKTVFNSFTVATRSCRSLGRFFSANNSSSLVTHMFGSWWSAGGGDGGGWYSRIGSASMISIWWLSNGRLHNFISVLFILGNEFVTCLGTEEKPFFTEKQKHFIHRIKSIHNRTTSQPKIYSSILQYPNLEK